MKYVQFINQCVGEQIADVEQLVLFGQNISAGSCLGGLTRGLKVHESSLVLNTANAENSLTGMGLGLMMNGVSSIFFMKQLDFLLLGVDHLVNTYNYVRLYEPRASFTIMPIVVDLGYQGLQSSFNNLSDLCSVAHVPGYTISNQYDARFIIENQLLRPGFRIIAVSQRLFQQPVLEWDAGPYTHAEGKLFQYTQGRDVTIVCFNFTFPEGAELQARLKAQGMTASLFSVNCAHALEWEPLLADIRRTGRLVVLDDSKSENLPSHALLASLQGICDPESTFIVKRTFSHTWMVPHPDRLDVDYDGIIDTLARFYAR